MLRCKSFKNISGQIDNILLFGIVHSVKRYTEKSESIAIKNGMTFYCNAKDENGNIYKLFSNYDPAIETTETIAFLIK